MDDVMRVAAGDAGARAGARSIRTAWTVRGASRSAGIPDITWRTSGLPAV